MLIGLPWATIGEATLQIISTGAEMGAGYLFD